MIFRGQGPSFFGKLFKAHPRGFKDFIKKIMNGFPFKIRIKPPGQLKVNLNIRPASLYSHRLVNGLQGHPPGPHPVFFKKGGSRQNDIGIP